MGKTTSGKKKSVAIFAAGCFWSKEYAFSRLPGVISTRVGYTGGHTDDPSYHTVCGKLTGHAEAVEVTFDPEQTDFTTLAKYFFEIHDPSIDRRAKGGQYRSAIFYTDEEQFRIAQQLIADLQTRGIEAVTELQEATTFWPAEARHQKYCDTRGMEPTDRYTKRF
ncbi:peptide-methionine (S)-S-oxide reductase MsrA [Flavilitoribacter nigricans]|uniref:Peptide methionine sulfoxide reductase MsrA n=1 Tax=Flavilitoribacter nigricans (strain ATCC 23147 / DSM 23189 / NBRC 102662 / NCIMB 1420 / SS-2) TaxID=1122177 RepID=A0A2D0N6M2_FLAN2|nr:peptide-methionine (S)-S-oxide reductase MsrA [Flavilitoribacter nigricans]PHN04182.1 peptide-methionine (S)-S-oxide reductase [Flavilitoribacter nigricans DSM 23189 = NBRC 102662]